jgi:hypothetical protein
MFTLAVVVDAAGEHPVSDELGVQPWALAAPAEPTVSMRAPAARKPDTPAAAASLRITGFILVLTLLGLDGLPDGDRHV